MTSEATGPKVRVHPLLDPAIELTRATVADPFSVTDHGLETRVPDADYELVDSIDDADVVALPAHWDVYRGEARARALDRIAGAHRRGLRTVVWVVGDHEAVFDAPGALAFHLAAARRRTGRPNAVGAYPVFIEDRLDRDGSVARSGVGERPRVGFCGQADQSTAHGLARLARAGRDHVAYRSGRRDRYPEPLRSHIALRRRVLDILAASDLVDTDFIVRDRYRAGVDDRRQRLDPLEATNREFAANVGGTDYTVCVRGGGNFSTRLYEAMMRGRIPIIVDSGALLPWQDVLDWRRLAIVVAEDEIGRIGEIVSARHRDVGAEGVRPWQERCRATWLDWLSLEGYFSRFGSALAGR